VFLTAYDASNTQVDQAILTVSGGETPSGDACVSQPGATGNYVLRVGATDIRRVSLTYDAFPDPNVGYDDVAFCEARTLSVDAPVPAERLAITEIRPNPLTRQTTIDFIVSSRTSIEARIFDLTGRLVAELSPGWTAPGNHSIVWDGLNIEGSRVRPGIYMVRLQAADQNATARVILVH